MGDTKDHSKALFRDFFSKHDTPLKIFANNGDWFYKDIRCGILHQGEARAGWRILRSGPLLDEKAKTINATKFLHELQKAVEAYSELLKNDKFWILFKKKMEAVCDNCA